MDSRVNEESTNQKKLSARDIDKMVQENLAKWQSGDKPLAPLSEKELEIIYQIREVVNVKYFTPKPEPSAKKKEFKDLNEISEFISRLMEVEAQIEDESMFEYTQHCRYLEEQLDKCEKLIVNVDQIGGNLTELDGKYQQVSTKIHSLHHVSEQLMRQQSILKSKKEEISVRLKPFTLFEVLKKKLSQRQYNFNSKEFLDLLDEINTSIDCLKLHPEYKESYKYQVLYDQLLSSTLLNVVKYVNSIITEATNQVLNMDIKDNMKIISNEPNVDSAFSLYYGKFFNAAMKTSSVINYIEDKVDINEAYERSLLDCQKSYFVQRAPILSAAVSKALLDLRDKKDHSVFFRSAGLFIIKVCQDETACYKYFFKYTSTQLSDYLYNLSQNLYDILRPCLLSIVHIEVLTELCTILKEMIGEQAQNNPALDQFVNIMGQLLQDVEERLVFRTNIFFQYDLNAYEPSPGDLAYPEKLEQMEDIAEGLIERRSESRATTSSSTDPQEPQSLSASTVGQLRSFTGNSPADLHGMWYPTVKRTLVCLSRLYICLDRETFQGVAQEGLLICIKTIQKASDLITQRKTALDGKLFQVKHLLIIREQIAPFQADFTIKELSLDFSTMKSAAFGLVNNRKNIFSLSSNNALLEFLLEGTPKVKEYLIDSRKEIDKELKNSCESFIDHTTNLLIGNLLQFLQKVEQHLKLMENKQKDSSMISVRQQFPPQMIAEILKSTQRNIKSRIPEVQKSMRLYLANRETEFILFRPIKNHLINAFIQTEQLIVTHNYTNDERLLIGCPTGEQLNVLISSVSLTGDQEHILLKRSSSRQ